MAGRMGEDEGEGTRDVSSLIRLATREGAKRRRL